MHVGNGCQHSVIAKPVLVRIMSYAPISHSETQGTVPHKTLGQVMSSSV